MTAIFDTNVLIAILNDKEPFHDWAVRQLKQWKTQGPTLICDIIYCELSAGMKNQADVDKIISDLALERLACEDDTLFRAGMVFKKYKKNGGTKSNVLPDFLIGALADTTHTPLVTANGKDYHKYFPDIVIMTPTSS